MPIDKNEITKEMIAKAMQCETADELIALANSEGIELTKEEAECGQKSGGCWYVLYCLLKEDRALVLKKAEVF